MSVVSLASFDVDGDAFVVWVTAGPDPSRIGVSTTDGESVWKSSEILSGLTKEFGVEDDDVKELYLRLLTLSLYDIQTVIHLGFLW